MVCSSADALAASAFSYSSASASVSDFFGNSFPFGYYLILPPTDGYRKTTEARS